MLLYFIIHHVYISAKDYSHLQCNAYKLNTVNNINDTAH